MIFEPDYSKYTLDELLDVSDHINREKYPERAHRLDEEIFSRKTNTYNQPLSKHQNVLERSSDLSLVFSGSAQEYFRIWIVNHCLSFLTLGIFSAWAKVRKKRYIYSHTTLDGTPFQYLGQPIPILKGRLIAAVGFLLYYISSHFFTSLLPFVLLAGLVFAPWVLVRSAAFNARYSAFRNMTFRFDGKYIDALKALYVLGIIPAIVISMIFEWKGKSITIGITVAMFFFAFPWWIKRIKKFIVEHTSYGDKKGEFFATGGQFFTIYFITGMIFTLAVIPSGILASINPLKKTSPFFYISAAVIYAGYVIAYAYNQSRIGNLTWNSSRLGPVRFQSTLSAKELLKLYVTNAFGIVFSLGILIPWAVMRTMKYRAENMAVFVEGDLSEFQGSDLSTVSATGAETLDFFDMDLSL